MRVLEPMHPMDAETRFWSQVDKSGECWIWTGSRDERDRPRCGFGGRKEQPSRIAWELIRGQELGRLRLWRCTANRFCVNPDHGNVRDTICDGPLTERYWSKVRKTDGCWYWEGRTTTTSEHNLAGRISDGGTTYMVHSLAYAWDRGIPVAEAPNLRHSCRNALCVNPRHLRTASFTDKPASKGNRERFWGRFSRSGGCLIADTSTPVQDFATLCKELGIDVPRRQSSRRSCDTDGCMRPSHYGGEFQWERSFWARVKKTKTCWLWQGTVSRYGYGEAIMGDSRRQAAHKISYLLKNGQYLPGLLLCHTCDNKLCVRPSHMRLGTHADNMRDLRGKGRGGPKLSKDTRSEIRRAYAAGEGGYATLAERFGVCIATIKYQVSHGEVGAELKARVLDLYENRCVCCGASGADTALQIDHVLPVSSGGTSAIENLQPLCGKCNRLKGAQVIDYRASARTLMGSG